MNWETLRRRMDAGTATDGDVAAYLDSVSEQASRRVEAATVARIEKDAAPLREALRGRELIGAAFKNAAPIRASR